MRKRPILERVPVGPDGLPGDGSQERMHHTRDMALHAFSLDRYPAFNDRAGFELPVPAFGENLSVEGGTEDAVCVGDRLKLGTALVEISQPTIRCAKLGRNLGLPDLLAWIEETGYCGYYLRVLEPGETEVGDEMNLLNRPHPEWTIARLHAAMFGAVDDVRGVLELPEIGPLYAAGLRKRLRLYL